MQPEIESACLKAAARLGVGLSLVAALVGIRMVTATPDGVAAGIEQLERLDAEIAAGESEPAAESEAVGSLSDAPRVSGVGEALPAPQASPDVRDDDALVSCRLAGRTQFMRAHDCAMRGGRSTVVPDES